MTFAHGGIAVSEPLDDDRAIYDNSKPQYLHFVEPCVKFTVILYSTQAL